MKSSKIFNSLVIVGSSGTGKTTLINGLRIPDYSPYLSIPRRYITRPKRRGDDIVENCHITYDEFDRGVEEGNITPYWSRTLDNERVEQYGFERVVDGKVKVYSANNAFLRSNNPSVRSVLQTSLIIFLHASSSARESRLAVRSPDMLLPERQVRLEDDGRDILGINLNIEKIDTSHLDDVAGQAALRGIVDRVLATHT